MATIDTSGIDITKPNQGNALTQDVRDNFSALVAQLDKFNSGTLDLSTSITHQPIKGVTAMRALSPVNEQRYYLGYHTSEGDGGHGWFRGVTGAAASTYTDNNGTIIVPTGGDGSAAFLREDKIFITSGMFGCAFNGVTDDSTGLGNLFTISNSSLALNDGSHLISSKLTWSKSNCVLKGFGDNSEILMTNGFRMLDFAEGVSNVVFEDIKFRTTYTQATDQAYGLLSSESKNLTNIKFVRCTFSAPNAKANAVKLIAQGASRVRGIEFIDCDFEDILRMGVEVQNHDVDLSVTSLSHSSGTATAAITAHGLSVNDRIQIIGSTTTEWNGLYYVATVPTADSITFAVPTTYTATATGTITAGVYKYSRIKVRDCRFKDLPTIPASGYGMGISLSGYGDFCSVDDNYFENVYNAVELVGCSDSSFTLNKLGRNCYFGIRATNTRIMYNNDISHTICLEPTKARTIQVDYHKQSRIIGNHMSAENSFTTDGTFVLSNSNDCTISLNTIIATGGSHAGYVNNSYDNLICDNIFDNSNSSANLSTLRCNGAATTGNRIERNTVKKGTGGVYWDEAGSATGNYFWDNNKNGAIVYSSFTWDPPSIAAGSFANTIVSVAGSEFGDFVFVSPGVDLQNLGMSASVIGAGSIEINLTNNTSAAIDLASSTWKVRAIKGI